jgi:EmrB/QacA subfamily drug resistance transporter
MTSHIVTAQEKRLTLIALMVVFLLSALDQTIVSTAMPKIIEQLQGLELYAWVTTAYMLTSTVMVPIYGRLSDIYGRKPILLVGVVIFLLGSVLCGLSGEFGELPLLGGGITQLIAFRALQGIGGAALFSSSFSIIADLFTPRERGKYMGLFGGVFGLAGALGPLIGGFFTDHGTVTISGVEIAGWRWVFYVNLPLGLLSLFMIIFRMPKLSHRAVGRVDYIGAIFFIVAVVPFLLALTWGGHQYAWDSQRIVALVTTSVVMLAAFLWVEMRVADPMLPLGLFRNKVFSITNLAGFMTGMAFLGVVMFLPLFTQLVQGISATDSGLTLLPVMLGLLIAAAGSGYLVSRTGHYKPFIIGGMVVLIVGLVLLSQINEHTTPLDLSWRMFIVGLGLGPSQSLYNIAVQNAVPVNQIGIATSASQFFRQMGSVIGLSIFGTLLTHNLTTELPKHLPEMPGVAAPHKMTLSEAQKQAMDPDAIHTQIDKALDEQYAQIVLALDGDQAAVDEIVKNPALPEALKGLVRDGGVRAKTQAAVQARADKVFDALKKGAAGRASLLEDNIPAALKDQIRAIPADDLKGRAKARAVAAHYRDVVLADEKAEADKAVAGVLAAIKSTLQKRGEELAGEVEKGVKEGFSISITSLFGTALWIIMFAFATTWFIPVLPLRNTSPAEEREKAAAAASH